MAPGTSKLGALIARKADIQNKNIYPPPPLTKLSNPASESRR